MTNIQYVFHPTPDIEAATVDLTVYVQHRNKATNFKVPKCLFLSIMFAPLPSPLSSIQKYTLKLKDTTNQCNILEPPSGQQPYCSQEEETASHF